MKLLRSDIKMTVHKWNVLHHLNNDGKTHSTVLYTCFFYRYPVVTMTYMDKLRELRIHSPAKSFLECLETEPRQLCKTLCRLIWGISYHLTFNSYSIWGDSYKFSNLNPKITIFYHKKKTQNLQLRYQNNYIQILRHDSQNMKKIHPVYAKWKKRKEGR